MFLRTSSVPYASDNAALPTEVRRAVSNAVSTPPARPQHADNMPPAFRQHSVSMTSARARRQHAGSTPPTRRQRVLARTYVATASRPHREEFCVKAIVRGTRGHVWRCLLTQCVPAGADVYADTHGAGVQGKQRRPHRYASNAPRRQLSTWYCTGRVACTFTLALPLSPFLCRTQGPRSRNSATSVVSVVFELLATAQCECPPSAPLERVLLAMVVVWAGLCVCVRAWRN